MAVRLACKINRNIFQNLGKTCRSATARFYSSSDEAKPSSPIPPIHAESSKLMRFQLCKPRTSVERSLHNDGPDKLKSEAEIVKQNMQKLQLQPSMLPEYYKSPIDVNSASFPTTDANVSIAATQYRHFAVSKTYSNVTLPLKGQKLASPFPEPVKTMPSHQVSDQEKAEQMFAESRSRPNVNMQSSRRYSTVGVDPSKCKKKEQKKGGCVRKPSPNCKPPCSLRCPLPVRDPYPYKKCCKPLAPYPSYSEACVEELEPKPSECKICPWKPSEHPYFKPPKKKFHTTSSALRPLRKDDCRKPPGQKEPCGWVKKKDDKKNQKEVKNKTKPKGKSSASVLLTDTELEGMLMDMKKKPCRRPPPKCKAEKKKVKKKPASKPKKKASGSVVNLDVLFSSAPQQQQVPNVPPKVKLVRPASSPLPQLLDDDAGGCKKMPFDKCKKKKPKARKVESGGKCPKKKLKKRVMDCPGENKESCKSAPLLRPVTAPNQIEYLMKKKEKGKCPKIKSGTCKVAEPDDDPCGTKPKPGTQKCPANVFKRKKKPRGKSKIKDPCQKKKASSIIPPPVKKSTNTLANLFSKFK